MAATEISGTTGEPAASPRTEPRCLRTAVSNDPPGRVVRPVERERPALGEGRGAVLRAAHDGRSCRGPRRSGSRRAPRRRSSSPAPAPPAPPRSGSASRAARAPPAASCRVCVAAVEQLGHGLGRRHALERRVVAVHRLGPGAHRAARGRLEHVGAEAARRRRERSSARARASPSKSTSARSAVVKPSGSASATASSVSDSSSSRCSSDHGDATIGSSSWWSPSALCSIDWTIQAPSRRASVQYSDQRHELVLLARAHDLAAVRVEHVGAQPGLDPHDGAVLRVVLAVRDAHVQDRRVAEHLDAVVPALAVEVVEAAVPLHQQVGPDQPARARCAVARVPRHLGGAEQRDGVPLELVRGEVGVVLGGLGGRRAHPLVALAQLAAVANRVDGTIEQEHAEEPEDDHGDDRVAAAAAGRAAAAEAAAAAASSAAAEAAAAGAGLGDEGIAAVIGRPA